MPAGPPPVSRRSLFTAAAAAALAAAAGCAPTRPWARGRAAKPSSASAAAASANRLPMLVDTDTQSLPSFAAFDPSVRPLAPNDPSVRAMHPGPVWSIGLAQPGFPPQNATALDPALRHANFATSTLLPGAMAPFNKGGKQWAMPTSLTPYAVVYQPAAFAAAGVPPPTSAWTLDDFTQACAAIQIAVRDGALPGFYGPLPPLLGTASYQATVYVFQSNDRPPKPTTVTRTFLGDLSDGVLCAAFAAGFGGWLARGGRFDFTNAGALAGLGRLLDIALTYGAPASHLPQTPNQLATYRRGAAMYVELFVAVAGGSSAHWVRLPRLPQAAVVPAKLTGVDLLWRGPTRAGTFFGPDGGATHEPPDEAVDAVVQFARWQYQRVSQNPEGDFPPPVVADPAVQRRYWQAPAQAQTGASAIADGQGFLFMGDWPNGLADEVPAGALFAALNAAAGGEKLEDALAAAERQLNTSLG